MFVACSNKIQIVYVAVEGVFFNSVAPFGFDSD